MGSIRDPKSGHNTYLNEVLRGNPDGDLAYIIVYGRDFEVTDLIACQTVEDVAYEVLNLSAREREFKVLPGDEWTEESVMLYYGIEDGTDG